MNVYLTPRAGKDLESLPKSVQRKLARIIDFLGKDPKKAKPTKLKGYEGLYRVHAGRDYVIVYAMEGKDILVARIAHRGEAYKKAALKSLSKRKRR